METGLFTLWEKFVPLKTVVDVACEWSGIATNNNINAKSYKILDLSNN